MQREETSALTTQNQEAAQQGMAQSKNELL